MKRTKSSHRERPLSASAARRAVKLFSPLALPEKNSVSERCEETLTLPFPADRPKHFELYGDE